MAKSYRSRVDKRLNVRRRKLNARIEALIPKYMERMRKRMNDMFYAVLFQGAN